MSDRQEQLKAAFVQELAQEIIKIAEALEAGNEISKRYERMGLLPEDIEEVADALMREACPELFEDEETNNHDKDQRLFL